MILIFLSFIIVEPLATAPNSTVIYPSLKSTRFSRCARLIVYHNIRVDSDLSQFINSFQILLVRRIIIRQNIGDYFLVAEPGDFLHHLEPSAQILVRIVPREVQPLYFDFHQYFRDIFVSQVNIQSLAKISPCAAVNQ